MTGGDLGRWARRPTAPPAGRPAPGKPGSTPAGRVKPQPHGAAGSSDRGSATAELAASLPALVLMVFVALTAVTAARTQLECVDAAREAARAAARGDSGVSAGRRVAPEGALVVVAADPDAIRATVRATVHPLGGRLPGFEVAATAVAAPEPGVPA